MLLSFAVPAREAPGEPFNFFLLPKHFDFLSKLMGYLVVVVGQLTPAVSASGPACSTVGSLQGSSGAFGRGVLGVAHTVTCTEQEQALASWALETLGALSIAWSP